MNEVWSDEADDLSIEAVERDGGSAHANYRKLQGTDPLPINPRRHVHGAATAIQSSRFSFLIARSDSADPISRWSEPASHLIFWQPMGLGRDDPLHLGSLDLSDHESIRERDVHHKARVCQIVWNLVLSFACDRRRGRRVRGNQPQQCAAVMYRA
jgi:hypothetical protein